MKVSNAKSKEKVPLAKVSVGEVTLHGEKLKKEDDTDMTGKAFIRWKIPDNRKFEQYNITFHVDAKRYRSLTKTIPFIIKRPQ